MQEPKDTPCLYSQAANSALTNSQGTELLCRLRLSSHELWWTAESTHLPWQCHDCVLR